MHAAWQHRWGASFRTRCRTFPRAARSGCLRSNSARRYSHGKCRSGGVPSPSDAQLERLARRSAELREVIGSLPAPPCEMNFDSCARLVDRHDGHAAGVQGLGERVRCCRYRNIGPRRGASSPQAYTEVAGRGRRAGERRRRRPTPVPHLYKPGSVARSHIRSCCVARSSSASLAREANGCVVARTATSRSVNKGFDAVLRIVGGPSQEDDVRYAALVSVGV